MTNLLCLPTLFIKWTGLTVKKHKDLKGLKVQNLRDHMSEAELIFTALAELSTRQIAETDEAKGLIENAKASKRVVLLLKMQENNWKPKQARAL